MNVFDFNVFDFNKSNPKDENEAINVLLAIYLDDLIEIYDASTQKDFDQASLKVLNKLISDDVISEPVKEIAPKWQDPAITTENRLKYQVGLNYYSSAKKALAKQDAKLAYNIISFNGNKDFNKPLKHIKLMQLL